MSLLVANVNPDLHLSDHDQTGGRVDRRSRKRIVDR
jgi:hypothetical protein